MTGSRVQHLQRRSGIFHLRIRVPVVEQALGRPIRREVLTVPDVMRRYRAVFAIGRGMWWDKNATFNARRGIPVTDAASWLQAHLGRPA